MAEIFISDKIRFPHPERFVSFLQKVANRRMQGQSRYGDPHAGRLYLTRLAAELKAYRKTGNAEHLLNIAVYAHLEMEAPEHPRAHLDATVVSVTRRLFGA